MVHRASQEALLSVHGPVRNLVHAYPNILSSTFSTWIQFQYPLFKQVVVAPDLAEYYILDLVESAEDFMVLVSS